MPSKSINETKVALLLSGGVDSSVALKMLQESGYKDITAFYLKIWLEDELAFLGDCPWEEDMKYAREVCEQNNVELKVVNLQSEYLDRVVSYALEELKVGRTPSPDIHCNERIKFGAFFEKLKVKYDKVASGHYAIVEENKEGIYVLRRGPDPVKDQSYFLSNLSQEQLSKILFPIGHLLKSEVREKAEHYNLVNQNRKDSQGICFLGKIQYRDFVKAHLGERTGDIIELETQKKLGEHKGFWFHTIGQRKGLGLGQGPWFVVSKDTEKNIVYVSHQDHSAKQERSVFEIDRCNWMSGAEPKDGKYVTKLRHGPELTVCCLESQNNGVYKIKLEGGDQGVAPGQHAIIYEDDICLGGGVII